MQKNYFFAIAGAGLLLAGCVSDPIMDNHQYRTIPVDDPHAGEKVLPGNAAEKGKKTVDPAKNRTPVVQDEQQFQYQPMTGVVSSGGVDSIPGKKAKRGKKVDESAPAASGAYIVQRGDTPERIARKHKVRLSEFMKVNNLTEDSARRLRVGQKLVIPGKSAVTTSKKAKTSAEKSNNAPALENGKYKVQSGDYPERIARRFKVKLKDLMAVNNLSEDSARRLRIGQALIIPGAVPPPQIVNDVQTTVDSTEKTAVVPAVENKKTQPAEEKTAVVEQKETKAETETTTPGESDNYVVWEADADTTYAAVAAKYGISEAKLRDINTAGEAQQITKGEMLFVPQK